MRIASVEQIDMVNIMELSVVGQVLKWARQMNFSGGLSLCRAVGWNMRSHSHLMGARHLAREDSLQHVDCDDQGSRDPKVVEDDVMDEPRIGKFENVETVVMDGPTVERPRKVVENAEMDGGKLGNFGKVVEDAEMDERKIKKFGKVAHEKLSQLHHLASPVVMSILGAGEGRMARRMDGYSPTQL